MSSSKSTTMRQQPQRGNVQLQQQRVQRKDRQIQHQNPRITKPINVLNIIFFTLLYCSSVDGSLNDHSNTFSRKQNNRGWAFDVFRRPPTRVNPPDTSGKELLDKRLKNVETDIETIDKESNSIAPSTLTRESDDDDDEIDDGVIMRNNESNGAIKWDSSINNANSIITALYLALKKHLTLDRIITLGRVGIGYILISQIWTQLKIIWDEAMDDLEAQHTSSSNENDALFLSSETIQNLQPNNNNNNNNNDLPKNRRGAKHQTTNLQAVDLATRLHSTGLHANTTAPNSIPRILSTLTKTEAQILSSSLLTPPSSPSSSSTPLAGLSDIQSSLADILHTLTHAPRSPFSPLLTTPPGILLYGPPGCGKTLLARTLSATTPNVRFLSVSPSTLLRKYVGETNLHVRALFSLAKKIRPCVIFIDEMDGLFRERSGEEHDWSRDLKTEFMSLWDGIADREEEEGESSGGGSSKILIIGATNRPFDVDPAFLRRLSRSFFLGLPPLDARMAILERMLQGIPLEDGFCVACVATNMEGYSPSDMKEVLRTAAMRAYKEGRVGGLKMEDVISAFQRVRPTRWGSEYREKLREWTMRDVVVEESEDEEGEGGEKLEGEGHGMEVHHEELLDDWESSDVNLSEEVDDSDEE